MSLDQLTDRREREAVRLGFFRRYRREPWFSSVSVRPDGSGAWYLSVGVTADPALEDTYEGLPIRPYRTASAVHAVAYPA